MFTLFDSDCRRVGDDRGGEFGSVGVRCTLPWLGSLAPVSHRLACGGLRSGLEELRGEETAEFTGNAGKADSKGGHYDSDCIIG